MNLIELLLLPGTLMCRYLDVDPKKDLGLLRSMFNMLFYLGASAIILMITRV